jgi:hypothetical protein
MIILIDSNEQIPLLFHTETETKKLYLGDTRYSQDYTLKGFETVVGIEYKRLSDFYGSIGSRHIKFMEKLEVFKREIKNPYLLIPNLKQILDGCNCDYTPTNKQRRFKIVSKVKDYQIVGSLIKISEMGIKVRFATDDIAAAKFIMKLFQHVESEWKKHELLKLT